MNLPPFTVRNINSASLSSGGSILPTCKFCCRAENRVAVRYPFPESNFDGGSGNTRYGSLPHIRMTHSVSTACKHYRLKKGRKQAMETMHVIKKLATQCSVWSSTDTEAFLAEYPTSNATMPRCHIAQKLPRKLALRKRQS